MNVLDTLLHFAGNAMVLYAAYVVLGALAFGFFIWRRVYAAPRPVEHRLQRPLSDSDSSAH